MAIGGLFATVVPWATTKAYPGVDDHRSFRIPLYIAVALPVITLALELFMLVESPQWLLMRGRTADARKSIRFMYPMVSEEEIDMTCAQLAYTLEKEAEEAELNKQSTYLDCFKGVDLRRSFCAIFPPITQNLTGQNLAGTYALTIFNHRYTVDFFTLAKQKDPLTVGLAANIMSFFLIESRRVGRFFLLFSGVIVMTGCMRWAYTAESGSSRLRAKTTTLGTVGNAIIGLIMTTVLPYLLSADYGAKWGAKTGYLFAGLGAVCIILIWFFIPDFTGRSYAQIDELFSRKISARKFASTECTGDYGRNVTAREVEEMAGVH
ncbi:hypothetical protein QFC24_006529 [Naganishia onofrii]|uniref:Uncharacterized protein n=1 Tax=Naganishia onofrii TaxID=1851511 RepID=A0ACC2WZ65_9TREE|nr:hypothetical protein QFC24_006529 [Naganishia onofrii]